MRLSAVVFILLTSCAAVEQPPVATATPPTSLEFCREGASPLEAAGAAAPEMVLLALARTQTNDLRCGPPPQTVRVCRALFVLSVVDPVHSLDEPEDMAHLRDALSWVLQDAASVADDSTLAAALLRFDELNNNLVTAADDTTRAQVLQQRADPAILDPIEAAWTRCA